MFVCSGVPKETTAVPHPECPPGGRKARAVEGGLAREGLGRTLGARG